MKIKKSLLFLLMTFCVCLLTSKAITAQCSGTYFKTDYRKIGAVEYGTFLKDLNNDGFPDFWKAQPDASNGTLDLIVYYHTGNGDWDFDNPTVFNTDFPSAGFQPLSFQPEFLDYDSDGKIDFKFLPFTSIYRNDGNGNIMKIGTSAFPGEQVMQTIGFKDITGDGLADWINVIYPGGSIHSLGFRPGRTDGTFGARTTLIDSAGIINTPRLLGDFDGDGDTDIYYVEGQTRKVFFNDGSGNFTSANGGSGIAGGEVKDFNGDGKDDFFTGATVYLSNGDGTFSTSPISCTACFGTRIVEINGDNSPDIINASYINNPDGTQKPFYSVFINSGNGTFTKTEYFKHYIDSRNSSIFFDHDGDGKDDLYDRSGTIYNAFGEPVTIVKKNVCNSFGLTHYADFDSSPRTTDVVADVVRWNPNFGNWTSQNLAFGGTNGPPKQFNWGTGALGDIPALGDFDGDHRTDYSVYRNSNGSWYIYRSSDSTWSVVKFGLPGDIPVPADYDGGGQTDIAVFRPSDGNWYIFYSETQQFAALHWGTDGDKPVPADYDGDGQTDIAVYRPSNGVWYYINSSDSSYGIVNWGIETDVPLPADYDGDGRADLTVFRDGDWYFLRSSNNTFKVIHWGTTGDFAFPHYRNGVISELVVYRPLNGVVYNYRHPNAGDYFFEEGANIVRFGLPNN